MALSATDTTLHVSQLVTLTARLDNLGCVVLGEPLYRLRWETSATQPVFNALTALEVVHCLAVAPGKCDDAQFVLQAVAPGEATLRAWVSYEVHLGYPGPAYWSGRSAPSLVITVTQ